MVITWLGQSCFKIQSGDVIVVTDPFSKETGLTPPRFRADVVTLSHAHDHLQSESIPENPIVINGPGEYETKGVMIRGVGTYHDSSEGKERGLNTAYIIEMEDMKVCHLGDFGDTNIHPEALEGIGTVDILLIPVGGKLTIDGKTAKKLIDQIEPRIVIPMSYKTPDSKMPADPIDGFLKEMGIKSKIEEDRLTLKKKDLPQTEETKVYVLKVA